jgi:hypothetical protein
VSSCKDSNRDVRLAMNAPVYVNLRSARNQLLTNGVVYTCRHKKRIKNNMGVTTARKGNFKKCVELAEVNVEYVGRIEKPRELKPYLKESGFETVKEWVLRIKGGLPAHLYRVSVVPH